MQYLCLSFCKSHHMPLIYIFSSCMYTIYYLVILQKSVSPQSLSTNTNSVQPHLHGHTNSSWMVQQWPCPNCTKSRGSNKKRSQAFSINRSLWRTHTRMHAHTHILEVAPPFFKCTQAHSHTVNKDTHPPPVFVGKHMCLYILKRTHTHTHFPQDTLHYSGNITSISQEC